MKGVKNEEVNKLWEGNASRIYKDLLHALEKSQKVEDLLQNPLSGFTQRKLSEWSSSVIDFTESHFNTFGFTMLHYEIAQVLYDYLGSEFFAKYHQQVS